MKTISFDPARYLDSEEAIATYLSEVLDGGNPVSIMAAFDAVSRSVGISKIAQKTGLGEKSLYKAFAPGTKPRFETVYRVAQALGVQFQIVPARQAKTAKVAARRPARRPAHA